MEILELTEPHIFSTRTPSSRQQMESSNVQVITLTTAGVSDPTGSSSQAVLGAVQPSRSSVEQPFAVLSSLPTLSSVGGGEPVEPDCKRRRLLVAEPGQLHELRRAVHPADDKLEERLWNVLCCAVCLELPLNSIYQCSQGHLICIQCFNHLLADARIKDEQATCASCRCAISRETCTRNLAVEKAVREMPGTCKHCARQLPRMHLPTHESDHCEERPISCGFSAIGCPWRGPFHERLTHEQSCPHPRKSGLEVLDALLAMDRLKSDERRLQQSIFSLLSYEKIVFSDLQLKPYRTDEYIHRLFYETSRFSAFNCQFVVKARINDDQKDPSQSCDRRLAYQLVLKTKVNTPFAIHYLVLKVCSTNTLSLYAHSLAFTANLNLVDPFVRLAGPTRRNAGRPEDLQL